MKKTTGTCAVCGQPAEGQSYAPDRNVPEEAGRYMLENEVLTCNEHADIFFEQD